MTRATRSVRLNREMREGTLPPTLIAKTYHPGNVTDVSRPLIRSLSCEFQCHQRKTNASFEANQSALFACCVRYTFGREITRLVTEGIQCMIKRVIAFDHYALKSPSFELIKK